MAVCIWNVSYNGGQTFAGDTCVIQALFGIGSDTQMTF